jgi:ketosteroid isomerase-like protein
VPGDEQDILTTSRAFQRAIVANDAAAIARFIADEWVLVGQTGVGRRAEFLSMVESGDLTHSSMRAVDDTERVLVHGDTAVYVARVTNTAHYRGKEFRADEWTTDVYARTPDGWTCVLSHVTPIGT